MKKNLVKNLILIFIVSIFSSVYAATGNIDLSVSSAAVIKGKTFTVTIDGSADNNITALQGSLEYDSNKIAIESKSAGTGFSDLSGTGEIAIASTTRDNLSKSGELYTITFKVLDGAEIGETTISVKNATLVLINENSEQENIKVVDDQVVINIKADDTIIGTPDEEQQPEEQPQIPNNNNVNSDNNISNNNASSNKNTSANNNENATKLPQTGAESAGIIVAATLGSASIICYVSYRKYKKL